MPDRLRSRAVAPRLSRPAACFERLIFANEHRCNHQHEFLGKPAYRTFSGDCSWNPNLKRTGQGARVTDAAAWARCEVGIGGLLSWSAPRRNASAAPVMGKWRECRWAQRACQPKDGRRALARGQGARAGAVAPLATARTSDPPQPIGVLSGVRASPIGCHPVKFGAGTISVCPWLRYPAIILWLLRTFGERQLMA
jgi:hypothetical protein